MAALPAMAPIFLYAQPPMATVGGQVVEAGSFQAVPGAVVRLVPGNASLAATSDSTGHFRITAVPVGHYSLVVAAAGHDTLELPELWLRAGKQEEQRLVLTPSSNMLGSVTISALAREQLSPLGIKPFTVEQSLRWPATFFDPARLLTALPGVAGINDQANHLSIRGNSPNANTWTLEGVEIVNPSHTGNAGTATDLPTLSGGGVTILSAQMLGPSQLLTGVLLANRDNALGGILDMHLRDGNMQRQEWTLQAGLLGLDASTEGPLGKRGRSSYLVNYRYSTVGLLSSMGIDLGDEAITFQDLAFHVALPAGKRGEVHLFGMGGNSSNRFKAVHDTTQWEVDKDSRNIDYKSMMGATGASLRVPLGSRTMLSSTVAVSEIDQDRSEERLTDDYGVGSTFQADLSERKLSGLVEVEGALGARSRWSVGGSATERRLTSWLNSDVHGWLLRPWVQGRWELGDRWQAMASVGTAYFTYTGETSAEPRALLEWNLAHRQKIALAAGMRSMLPQWQSFGVNTWPLLVQKKIGPTHSRDVVLGYDRSISDAVQLHAEVYYQQLLDLPVAAAGMLVVPVQPFSMVNVWDETVGVPLQATGTANNTGVELDLDRHFAGGFFWQANASFYSSRYKDVDGAEHDTRWDGQYLFNAFGGKEYRKVKEDRVRTWGFSGRANVAGGPWCPPLPVYTDVQGNVIYAGDPDWVQLPAYYRIDLRVYLKMDRKGRTGLWALDLQNVTGARNAAFRYFDFRKHEVITKYQLGLIPNLSYRIEF
jgi:hypothetical protein